MEHTIYEKTIQAVKQLFEKDAASYLSKEKTDACLKEEENLFLSAREKNISPSWVTGNNTARYAKTQVRRQQPGFLVYYVIGLLTEIAGFMLLWVVLRALLLLATKGLSNPFHQTIPLSYSLCVLAGYLLFREVSSRTVRKQLLQHKESVSRAVSMLAGILLTAAGCILFRFGILPFLPATMFYLFLFYVSMLILAGVHNVIYTSHIVNFFRITKCILFPNCRDMLEKNTNDYKQKNRTQFNYYNSDMDEKAATAAFERTYKSRLVSNRVYYGLACVLAIFLFIITLQQLMTTAVTISFAIFAVITLAVAVVTALCVITCNNLLKSKKS